MDKDIIVEVYNEHASIEEDLAKLPTIGNVIKIEIRNTSGRRGNTKVHEGIYRVNDVLKSNELMTLVNTKTNVRTSFTFFDMLRNKAIKWNHVENNENYTSV